MLLKAHNRTISADKFFHELDPGDQGLSLSELRDASKRYGLRAEVRCCTYEQLIGGCALPLIALLHPEFKAPGYKAGHYVLVVDADSDGVMLIDGTSGEQKRCPRDMFCRTWKGYVVVPTVDQTEWLSLAINVTVWMLIGCLILRLNRSGAPKKSPSVLEFATDASAT